MTRGGGGAAIIAALAVVLWCVTAGFWVGSMTGGKAVGREDLAMRIDVNHADAARLELLPGIGPKLAEQIVKERGIKPFERPRDLMRVSGIGGIVMQRVEPMVECR